MKRKKLKIGFVLDTTLDSEDGVQQYILVLGDYLKSIGHDVSYVVGETKRKDIENIYSLTRNLKVHFNGNKVVTPLPASTKKIKNFLESEEFDVLHVQSPHSPYYAGKFMKHASNKTVLVSTFHIMPYNFVAYFGTWFLGLILWRQIKKLDLFIAVSEANKPFALKTFHRKATIVPNMVKLDEFRLTKKKTKIVKQKELSILFLGRLTKRKGCEHLLHSLKLVKDARPDLRFRLKVAGKGEMLSRLEQIVDENGLGENVEFLGFVSNSEKVELMSESDISVFPSYSGESFGIVLIEAMASGSGLVLGGDNPGYRSVLGQDVPEALLDVRNHKKFSKSLIEFMSDVELRNKTYEKQQKLVKKYDYKTVGKIIDDYYQKLYDQKK